jgi:hypothetical protein
MASLAATTTAARTPAVGSYDRLFYSGMAIAMAVTVFAGFAPTFYLRSLFGAPPTVGGATTLTPLTQLHGVLFTAWVVLFIVQTALVASHRTRVHQRLGVAGSLLAVTMIVVGVSTAIAAARRGSAPPGADPRAFLIVPLTDMVLFAGFVAAALSYRRNREAHKRLMLLAYVSIMAAAVARLPGVLPYGPFVFFGLSFTFLLAAVFYDGLSRRRVHPAYVWGGALLVVSVPVRLMMSGTQAWLGIAGVLTR